MENSNLKSIEDKLQEAQERFKALFEEGPVGATFSKIIYDEKGVPFDFKFIYTNDNFKKYTGVSPEGMTAREAFPGIENDPHDWIGKFGSVVQTGIKLHEEQLFSFNNRWYDLVAYKFKDDIFILTFLDITSHKTAQKELAELNAGMKSVFDASSRVAIIKMDHDGKIRLFNHGAEKLLGYKADEVIGKETPLLFHKDSEVTERSIELTKEFGKPIKGLEIFKAYANVGKTDEREWTYISKNGDEKNVSLSITPIENKINGISGYLGTAVDITDRKKVEKKLKESEQLFKSFFEESPDAFMLLENGRFIDCNRATVDLFGLSSKEDFTKVHPSQASPEFQPDNRRSDEKAEEMMKLAMKNGSNRFEWMHKKIDGEEFPAEVLLTHIKDGNRDLLHACVRDITDRKEAEEKLKQSQKMEVVGQLAGGVAHDFNNMLSGIIGATEILKSEYSNNKEQSEYIDMIMQAAERAADLTQQLLYFGRKDKQTFTSINIHDIIESIKKILSHTIHKNISISSELNASKPIFNGNTTQVQNAILNLCINARDAMPHGGNLIIKSSDYFSNGKLKDHKDHIIPMGDYIQIEITDTGIGIEKDQLDKIFEPFFTTKEIGQGTGLGLASVYSTLKFHNSFMQIDSSVGKGTTFKLYFPQFIEGKKEESKEDAAVDSNIKGTILVIDDEQILRTTIKVMLESIGMTVILAENGVEGIKKFAKYNNDIDLVILDIIMPQLGGRECLKELYKIDSNLKSILISGHIKDENLQDILKEENNIFLRKPFRKKELISVVNKVLNL